MNEFEFVVVPVGTFVMGESPPDRFATDTERPAHPVAIAKAFGLGRFPVTVGAYRTFSPEHAPGEPEEYPVVGVSWSEARSFCGWLGHRMGAAVRLPSESEWEYACRAGGRTAFSATEELGLGDANFLYSEEGERVGEGGRSAEGRYPPNGFGLLDMHGNVCEWVQDAWHPTYEGAPCDGSAWEIPDKEDRRVVRGGAWDYLPRLLRSAWRDGLGQDARRDNVGFRLACTL